MEGMWRTLPDDIIYQILLKLPARSIAQLRCVSKIFNTLTSQLSFIHSHALRSIPVVLAQNFVSLLDGDGHIDLYPFDTINGSHGLRRLQKPREKKMYLLSGSCNGLLCFIEFPTWWGTDIHVHYWICNPLTQEWILLPFRSGTLLLTFYFHPSTREYRLLWNVRDEQGLSTYEILTLGTNTWRPIKTSPPWLVMKSDTSTWVSLNDDLHWIAPKVIDGIHSLTLTNFFGEYQEEFLHIPSVEFSSTMIYVFNMKSEEFRRISPPGNSVRYENHLMEMGGSLGLWQVTSPMAMDIWILKDYHGKAWDKQYTLSVPIAIGGEIDDGGLETLTAPNDKGEILIGWGRKNCQWDGFCIGIYNLKLNTIRKLEVEGLLFPWFHDNLYTESLVSYKSIEKGVGSKVDDAKY